MFELIRRGLKTGVVTTRYPFAAEPMPAGYIGQIELKEQAMPPAAAAAAVAVCPTDAIRADAEGQISLDRGRCIGCGLCAASFPEMFMTSPATDTARRDRKELVVISGAKPAQIPQKTMENPFRRSLHIRHVDVGDDNATVSEISLLNSPAYDMHRLGFFFTTSPRHADALLVSGVVTRAMERPLRETYDAMPFPKLVIAAGTEAISGAPFGGSDAVVGGVDTVLPTDIFIPGSPPAPLALLYGLLLATGRADRRGGPNR